MPPCPSLAKSSVVELGHEADEPEDAPRQVSRKSHELPAIAPEMNRTRALPEVTLVEFAAVARSMKSAAREMATKSRNAKSKTDEISVRRLGTKFARADSLANLDALKSALDGLDPKTRQTVGTTTSSDRRAPIRAIQAARSAISVARRTIQALVQPSSFGDRKI